MRFAPQVTLIVACLSLRVDAAEAPPTAYDAELLTSINVRTDDVSLQTFLRKLTPPEVDSQTIPALIAQLGSRQFPEREAASKQLVASGPMALAACREATRHPAPEVALRARAALKELCRTRSPQLVAGLKAAVRTLAMRKTAGAAELLLSLLPTAIDEELEEEIWFALDDLAAKQESVAEPILTLLHDGQPLRRAAAGYLAARRGTAAQREVARPLLADCDPVVRLRVAQGFLGAKDKAAIAVLIELLGSLPAVTLAWQAEELLRWAAAESSPASRWRRRRACANEVPGRVAGVVADQGREVRCHGLGARNAPAGPDAGAFPRC